MTSSLENLKRTDSPARLTVIGVAVAVLLGACAGNDTDAMKTESVTTAVSSPPIHPAFTVTEEDLPMLLEDLPQHAVHAIMDRPAVFLDIVDRLFDEDPILLRLVDKEHLLPESYTPEDIVTLAEYDDQLVLNRGDLALRGVVLPDLLAMVEAASQEGIALDISSSYRSYSYQDGLFRYWVEELGQEEAERVSARPGSSQHQLGTTVDFGSVTDAFAEHPAGMWLANHAWEYGFSLSYPDGYEELTGYKYEPWHFRWISRPAALLEREFFGGIQQEMLMFLYAKGQMLQATRTNFTRTPSIQDRDQPMSEQ